jgi:hypothetical protein
MNLIAYSDSEESGDETSPVPKPVPKPAPKPAFQKVVDRSNPGKIKLQLPTPSQAATENDDIESEAPPAKKARTGSGAFSGFNAMLPAPKRPNLKATASATGVEAAGGSLGKRGLGKSLGVGVNLKTGAEPAFRREPKLEEYDETGNPVKQNQTPMQAEDFRAIFNLPPAKTDRSASAKQEPQSEQSTPVVPEVKQPDKPRFLPLSVARGKKKKPLAPRTTATETGEREKAPEPSAAVPAAERKPVAKPKVSLFSMTEDEDDTSIPEPAHDDYKPLLYGAEEVEDPVVRDAPISTPHAPTTTANVGSGSASNGATHDLNNLASELNLTESQRRQLFGRRGHGPDLSAANIIEFNTDKEYEHNEQLRQQGETVQHKALKSITGTGKNSLRSLVNVAT